MLDDSRYNVPYFCPKCGRDKTNFDSLVALRHHVDVFHFKLQRDPLPKIGYQLSPPLEWSNQDQDLHSKHLRPGPDFPDLSSYNLPSQTPWISHESTAPGPPSSRPADRGVPNEVSQTLKHLEDLRRSSDKALSSQREQLKRLEEQMRAKEDQLERTQMELERAADEKRKLETECLEMRKDKVEDQEKVGNIMKKIEEQNQVVDKKEKELRKLRDFIRNAAEKEGEAKKKLEETVEKILLRAEKAEKELEEIRAKNSRSAEELQPTIVATSNESPTIQNKDARSNSRANEVRDVISGSNMAYAAAASRSASLLSNVESLPAELRNRAAEEAVDEIEGQDLSPLAQEYIKNFLAYYRALRRSELQENPRRQDAMTEQQPRSEFYSGGPIAAGTSDPVTGLRENPVIPERDLNVFDYPIQPSEYPVFESSPYRYEGRDPHARDDRTEIYRYNLQPGGRPSRDDWVMRSETTGLSATVPLRDSCWTPSTRYRDPYSASPVGRCHDDLELDQRGIVGEGEPRRRFLDVDAQPVKGSRRKRRPKTDPGYAARHRTMDRDSPTADPSTAMYPEKIWPSTVTRASLHAVPRRDGEGKLYEDFREPEAGQRPWEKFRLGDSLERGPDVSDTLTEVTRDSDDEAGSPALPERIWSVEGKPRQLGEGSTGDSADGKPADKGKHGEDEEEAEIMTPDDSVPSREITDGSSDAKTTTPVPRPRSYTVNTLETEDPVAAAEVENAKSSVMTAEVLALVLPHVDTLSLCQAALVSKEWRDVSRNPDVWQNVTIKDAQISSKFLVAQSKWCTKVRRISFEGIRWRSKKSNESDDVYAKKTRGCLESGFDAMLSASQDSIVAVSIIDCNNVLTERCLWQVSCYCRLLQDITYISDLDPVGPEVMWALGAGCRDVRYVRIPPKFPSLKPDRFNNKCANVIGRCWPLLLSLSIGGVEVDSKGLAIIAQCCLKLESLELDHMCEVTEEMATVLCQHGLKGLQRLRLTHTPATPKALLHFHSACPHLKSIDLQIEIKDYFGDAENEKNKRDYAEILDKLTKLKSLPGLENIFHLEAE